jgi:guanylate kinase
VDGIDYHFVDKETFLGMIREGDFLEWAEVYSGDLYGTSRSGLRRRLEGGMDVLLDVDVQGAKNVRQSIDDSTLIFLMPPSLEVLEKRLKGRATDSEDAVRTRIETAVREIGECRNYDYIVFNDQVTAAVRDIRSIIRAERLRSSAQMTRVVQIFPKV